MAPVPAADSAVARRMPGWLPAASLVGALLLTYVHTLHAPFLFDDTDAILRNPTIRHLWSPAVLSPPLDGSATTGRPLVNLTFALNYALSGETVWSYHATNLAIHALAALLLFGLVRRTLARPLLRAHFASSPSTVAFFTALLWALHPLQTESVTFVAQRTESLCGLFYLLTLYAVARAHGAQGANVTPNGPKRWLFLSIAASLLGMATKEVMVTAPLVVLLYDRTFVSGTFLAAWRGRRGYYSALAATWLLLAWLVGQGGGGRGLAAGFDRGVSVWHYLLTQCEALVLYVRLSLWPHPLVLDYGSAVVRSAAEVWWQGPLILAALASVAWALWRRPVAGFLGAWFFLILAPSSSFVPLVTQTIAEHRMYLPLAALVVAGVTFVSVRLGAHARWLLVIVAAGFATGTIARNHAYRNAVAIWSSSVAAHPASARAHNNLAQSLQQAGRSAEADARFAHAVALDPRYVSARYNWGVALLAHGRDTDALAQLQAAVQLAPDHVDALVNLGTALTRAQRPAEAVPHFERALHLRPAADVHFNLGLALSELDRPAPATVHLQAALQLNPNLPEAHYQLGRLAERAGRPAEAAPHFTTALRLAPDHLGAHRRLGLLCARAENYPAAAGHFGAALRIQPSDADTHANLGNALLLQGQVRAAIASYEEALRLRPDDARTREHLRLAREQLP